jgi:hypothetical protein
VAVAEKGLAESFSGSDLISHWHLRFWFLVTAQLRERHQIFLGEKRVDQVGFPLRDEPCLCCWMDGEEADRHKVVIVSCVMSSLGCPLVFYCFTLTTPNYTYYSLRRVPIAALDCMI